MMILSLVAIVMGAGVAAPPVASISLFNPTNWEGPVLVEIPSGSIAAPGVLDWRNVRLQMGEEEIPYAFRAVGLYRQDSSQVSGGDLRAEDLLVFACCVPPNSRRRVDVLTGEIEARSSLTWETGRIDIAYPNARVVVDTMTGALLRFEAFGREVLSAPFAPAIHRLEETPYVFSGAFGPGYQTPTIAVAFGDEVKTRPFMLPSFSTASMMEVRFLLCPEEGPQVFLTYRFYAFGMLEIALDEKPWSGESPWLHFGVRAPLALAGTAEPLPLLESRMPFYGYKDYAAACKEVACFHRGDAGGVLEFGDEINNGRHFFRRLYALPAERIHQEQALVESVNEGYIVEVEPVHSDHFNGTCVADFECRQLPPALEKTLRDTLENFLEDKTSNSVKLDYYEPIARSGIRSTRENEFSITSFKEGHICIRAESAFAQYSAVQALARHFNRFGREKGVPLIACNPVTPFRAGGFGGGNFEVDFPYGSEDEWRSVFDNLLDSGMNVFGCLGMWGDWKMPVSYQYIPELRSSEPDAYDESSGAKFSEFEMHRERGLRLMRYLHERGAKVWLWVPIGCAPTTFPKLFPEAMAPGSDKIPCFTHPEYARYVDAFFKELLETYPVDGLFLIRDDNGGICTCDRCKDYVARSRTKDPVWEQYLAIYDGLRSHGFKGDVGVYPYNDGYQPRLDPLLPEDLYVVGHGGGAAVLARRYDRIAPMGDTWIDNLYANFRLASSPRMKRLLCGRNSFWIGGAYCGTELPWESIGYFGVTPSASANTFRYDWGMRTFGQAGALPFVRMDAAYERLWEINAVSMPPATWIKLPETERKNVLAQGTATVEEFKTRLADLKQAVPPEQQARWYGHVNLFAPYFEYHLHRLDLFADIYARVLSNRAALETPEGLPAEIRERILADYAEMYAWAEKYNAVMQTAPEGMLSQCRWMTKPYKEWMAGYDQWLDWQLEMKQFAGTATIETEPLAAGKPFALRVELHNQGICPWIAGAGHRMEFSGAAAALGLPAAWEYEGAPMAPGDRRVVTFQGTAPPDAGEGDVTVSFFAPFRAPEKAMEVTRRVSWVTGM